MKTLNALWASFGGLCVLFLMALPAQAQWMNSGYGLPAPKTSPGQQSWGTGWGASSGNMSNQSKTLVIPNGKLMSDPDLRWGAVPTSTISASTIRRVQDNLKSYFFSGNRIDAKKHLLTLKKNELDILNSIRPNLRNEMTPANRPFGLILVVVENSANLKDFDYCACYGFSF